MGYYKHFREFWIPIYKRQVFKAKLSNDRRTLLEIKDNIFKNINLNKEEKWIIIKELGLYHLQVREDLECVQNN